MKIAIILFLAVLPLMAGEMEEIEELLGNMEQKQSQKVGGLILQQRVEPLPKTLPQEKKPVELMHPDDLFKETAEERRMAPRGASAGGGEVATSPGLLEMLTVESEPVPAPASGVSYEFVIDRTDKINERIARLEAAMVKGTEMMDRIQNSTIDTKSLIWKILEIAGGAIALFGGGGIALTFRRKKAEKG